MVLHINGSLVRIDDEDVEKISDYKWHISSTGYAVWRGIIDGKKQTIRMHRLITNCPKGLIVDHINHNTLDNRKSNLKVCTQSENMRNLRKQGRGYWYQKQNSNWVVEINGKHIGVFGTEDEADRIAKHIRSGGTYEKPKRLFCRYGHSLDDSYNYKNAKRLCRKCQSRRSKEYYVRKTKQGMDGNND